MPTKWIFTQAKSKLKNDEDIISYFILVESYEKHLNPSQKVRFLNPKTINGMFSVLSDQQLRHLKHLVEVFAERKFSGNKKHLYRLGASPMDYYGGEGLSKWFVENVYEHLLVDKKMPMVYCQDVCKKLLENITDYQREATRIQKRKKEIIDEYKLRLKKFDGNSMEYREWLILWCVDNGIPFIEKTYDVEKLLKRLSIEYLKKLKSEVEDCNMVRIFSKTRVIEPYFCLLAVSPKSIDDVRAENLDWNFMELIEKSGEYAVFKKAFGDLVSKIETTIKQKEQFVDNKLDGLVRTTTFYQDIEEIMRSLGNVDDVWLKGVISEYSTPVSFGKNYNDLLRKTVFLEKLLKEQSVSTTDLVSFRNKIIKAREYFLRHITDKEYTVYRGMGIDGLFELLRTAQPKIDCDSDDIISQVNEKTPIVYDEGFTSTSLNKGISASAFKGKERDNVFITIKIPRGSKGLVLDYEEIENISWEEELLLAPRTRMRINSIDEVDGHYEIDAEVID